MKLWKKLAGAAQHPFQRISQEVQEEAAETAVVSTKAALEYVGKALPEIGDLLAGEEVTLDVEVKLRLKQKGEI